MLIMFLIQLAFVPLTGYQVQSLKMFERQHRDQTNPISDGHCCSTFTEDMLIPNANDCLQFSGKQEQHCSCSSHCIAGLPEGKKNQVRRRDDSI